MEKQTITRKVVLDITLGGDQIAVYSLTAPLTRMRKVQLDRSNASVKRPRKAFKSGKPRKAMLIVARVQKAILVDKVGNNRSELEAFLVEKIEDNNKRPAKFQLLTSYCIIPRARHNCSLNFFSPPHGSRGLFQCSSSVFPCQEIEESEGCREATIPPGL